MQQDPDLVTQWKTSITNYQTITQQSEQWSEENIEKYWNFYHISHRAYTLFRKYRLQLNVNLVVTVTISDSMVKADIIPAYAL